jgi:hypothetical protein
LIRQIKKRLFTTKATRDTRLISIPTIQYLKYLSEDYSKHLELLQKLPIFSELSNSGHRTTMASNTNAATLMNNNRLRQNNILAQFYLGGDRKFYMPGQLIKQGNDGSSSLYFILSGVVNMVWKKQTVVSLGTRSCFGYHDDHSHHHHSHHHHSHHHHSTAPSPAENSTKNPISSLPISILSGSTTEVLVLSKHLLKRTCSRHSLLVLKEEMALQQQFIASRVQAIQNVVAHEQYIKMKRSALLDLGETRIHANDDDDDDENSVDGDENNNDAKKENNNEKNASTGPSTLSSSGRRNTTHHQRPLSSAGRKSETKYGKWSGPRPMHVTRKSIKPRMVKRGSKEISRNLFPNAIGLIGSSRSCDSPRRMSAPSVPQRKNIHSHIIKYRPNLVADYQRTVSIRPSIHKNDEKIHKLSQSCSKSPRVRRHLYLARKMRANLEILKKRRQAANKILDDEKMLCGFSHEKLKSDMLLY